MGGELFSVQTRQKAELLWGPGAPLKASETVTFDLREVSGYGAILFLALGDQSFRIRIFEASTTDGPWTLSGTLTSAVDSDGLQRVISQFSPTGPFMQIFVDNLAAADMTRFVLSALGLPIVGAGGGGGTGGGGGSGSGSAVSNRAAFTTNQVLVPTPGTAVQFQSQAVPNGFTIFLAALDDNDGNIYVGGTKADAENHTKANILTASAFRTLALTNTDEIWIDADLAGEGVQWMVEV